jgi:hypothetical protein
VGGAVFFYGWGGDVCCVVVFVFWWDEALLCYVAYVLFGYFFGVFFVFVSGGCYGVGVVVSVYVGYVCVFLFVFGYPFWVRFVLFLLLIYVIGVLL